MNIKQLQSLYSLAKTVGYDTSKPVSKALHDLKDIDNLIGLVLCGRISQTYAMQMAAGYGISRKGFDLACLEHGQTMEIQQLENMLFQ